MLKKLHIKFTNYWLILFSFQTPLHTINKNEKEKIKNNEKKKKFVKIQVYFSLPRR